MELHLREKEILEAQIPSNIVIGPFFVNVENVRQALSKKRKALSNAVLELLARKLRQQSDAVSTAAATLWKMLSFRRSSRQNPFQYLAQPKHVSLKTVWVPF